MKVQLKSTDGTENLYPVTGAQCVIFDNGKTLSEKIDTIESQLITDGETLTIRFSSSDGELTVEGLQAAISFEDGSPTKTLTANASGVCIMEIARGKVYTVTVSNQSGYQNIPPITIKATAGARTLNVEYVVEYSGYCTFTLIANPVDARSTALEDFVGVAAVITLSDNTTISGVFDSNGQCVLSNVPKGLTGETVATKVDGYITPSPVSFSTYLDAQTITLNYNAVSSTGFFMVRDDGEEIDYYSWDSSDTCVAIHVATAALVADGNDYYVKANGLTSAGFVAAARKQWGTQNVKFPNVPAWSSSEPYYDGKEATALMLSDASSLSITSPAAAYATSQTFTLNGTTVYGYIGTRDQVQALLDNADIVNQMISLAGYTPTWKSNSWWTSSQHTSAGNAWYLNGGSWNSTSKTYTAIYVVPFFAI